MSASAVQTAFRIQVACRPSTPRMSSAPTSRRRHVANEATPIATQ